jgi:glycosyltransferase involved in cell wall biosynthesis
MLREGKHPRVRRLYSRRVRVQIVDPSAYTPPYDHALCTALARAGAEVELVTSRFTYADPPAPEGYLRSEPFYRWAPGTPKSRLRLGAKLAQHVPGMLDLRRRAARADLVHFQWLAAQLVDAQLLPSGVPTVLTAHDVLPREPRPGSRLGQRRLYERVDGVVVHSEHGRRRLVEALGVAPAKVEVIPHGAFDYLTRLPEETPLPPGFAEVEQPVVLFFGISRPYKGADVLVEAWDPDWDAELWLVGAPGWTGHAAAAPAIPATPPGEADRKGAERGSNVRAVRRYVAESEIPAYFRRADLVVLPYREIDQSGVLFTALAFGKPLLLTDVGGFPEVAATGAAELVPPGDPDALREALGRLIADPGRRAEMAAASARAAGERYGWDAIARRHLELYARITEA